jgi:hypothetical protein
MHYEKALLVSVLYLVLASATGAAGADGLVSCRPYFGDACSEAMGRWLPRVPNASLADTSKDKPAKTPVTDSIVDPAGSGDQRFLTMRGVVGGSRFVYGEAGPPRGHAIYDPVRRIAFYDEGCCAWHHVALVSGASAPPKAIAMRSLAGVRTARGLRLGDPSAKVLAIFGSAAPQSVPGHANEKTLTFERDIINPKPDSPCEETMTFLFLLDRLTAMDFGEAC